MMFRLPERPVGELPLHVFRILELGAPPEEVFATLADHESWPTWLNGMSRVHVDGPAAGVGALRTVRVAPATVQERFSRWEPGERLTFHIVGSSLPGLAAMTEDWQLAPMDGNGSRLVISVGVEPARWLRFAGPLVRSAVARATAGASGIRTRFPI